jgi:hypothetical protein
VCAAWLLFTPTSNHTALQSSILSGEKEPTMMAAKQGAPPIMRKFNADSPRLPIALGH